MAGLRATDSSPFADALLLAALFTPFLPIVTSFYLYVAGLALGCPADTAQSCEHLGLDINYLYMQSLSALQWGAEITASNILLAYIALVAGLAQFTTEGFRGRVVRTCAVIMCAAVLPLILAFSNAMARGAVSVGDAPVSVFAFYGSVFLDWLANIAVPLAVLTTCLLALTLGYRLFIGKIVDLATRRD